jgi:hypothetical protein
LDTALMIFDYSPPPSATRELVVFFVLTRAL